MTRRALFAAVAAVFAGRKTVTAGVYIQPRGTQIRWELSHNGPRDWLEPKLNGIVYDAYGTPVAYLCRPLRLDLSAPIKPGSFLVHEP